MPKLNSKLLDPKRKSPLMLLRVCTVTGSLTNKTSERLCGTLPMSWRWWSSTNCRLLIIILDSKSTLMSKVLMVEPNNAKKSLQSMSNSPSVLRTLSRNLVTSNNKLLNMKKNSNHGSLKSLVSSRNISLVITTSLLRLKLKWNGSSRINSVLTMTKPPKNNSLLLLRNTVEWRLTMTSKTSLTKPT